MFQKQSYALRLLIEKISQRERYLLLATLLFDRRRFTHVHGIKQP